MRGGIKRWSPVEAVWRDAHGGDPGWEKLGKRHGKVATIRTIGQLARVSDAGIVIVLSVDRTTKDFGGYIFIPNENVVSLRELDK